jgi:hypothetical protein
VLRGLEAVKDTKHGKKQLALHEDRVLETSGGRSPAGESGAAKPR